MSTLALRHHAPDAAVVLVAVRVAEARLVVADDRVEPVRQVERAIGTKAGVHDAEGDVGGFDERWLSTRC